MSTAPRLVLLIALVALPALARAERLAARHYTTADGLSGDYVLRVTRDSRGFLWFSTRDGLSRFDGVRFVIYGVAQGLPQTTVNDVLETRRGDLWIATNGGGVCLFDPHGGAKLFTPLAVGQDLASNRVNVLFEDRQGTIWAGTDSGLFSGVADGVHTVFRRVTLPLIHDETGVNGVGTMTEDRYGNLWIGGNWGLVRRLPDGRIVAYRLEPAGPRDAVSAVHIDESDRLWIGFRSGLYLHHPPAAASLPVGAAMTHFISRAHASGEDRWFTTAQGLPDNTVTAIHVGRDREVWVGTIHGVAVIDGGVVRTISPRQGVPDLIITDLVEDPAGSLWITSVNGVIRLIRDGLVSFDQQDGLANPRIHNAAVDTAGRLFVVTDEYAISQFDGARFRSVRALVAPEAQCFWMSRCANLAPSGEWWMATTMGLYRWSGIDRVEDLARRQASDVFDARRGLPHDGAFSAFEDRDGNVWAGTALGGVAQWSRAARQWHTYSEADGLPPLRQSYGRLAAFAEDRSGSAWFAFDTGGLARFRKGRFEAFTPDQGAPAGGLSALLVDRQGRLWIGGIQAGLTRVDDPTIDRPVFRAFTVAHGLTTNNVRCLAEDDHGRLYAGTSRGIDRLDPATGTLRHFSVADGLASDFVTSATRDRDGALWFGTINGLSRLAVDRGTPAPASAPPAIFIAAVRLAGADQPVSELGEMRPGPLTIPPGRGPLDIEYFGFSFDPGSPLKYQYQLDGTDAGWSAPGEQRAVTYPRLAAGSYRFLVRAVRPDGVVSEATAGLDFKVLPPFYARWWFIAAVATAVGAVPLMLYRLRVAHLLRVERVRARIATDLHDDIGASLSQIAILAEVARQRMRHDRPTDTGPEPAAAEPLARIAETSRRLVDSMSDIVWAINPDVDSLADLVHRMRRFVEDTLGSADIEVTLRVPEPAVDLRLGADLRREIFLILKESVTNIAKHARATRVAIDFESDGRRLWLRISDDGRGFEPSASTDGNGVASMRRRVAGLGGRLAIDSAPGRGTTITLDVDRRGQ